MERELTRRALLGRGALALGAASLPLSSSLAGEGRSAEASAERPATKKKKEPLRISLNTSTLRGHRLPLTEVIDIAGRAGYAGIEPWIDEIERHLESGGSLKDLAARLKDRGLAVTGAIAFFQWMVDDDARRAQELEKTKRYLERLAAIGASHIAAPPAGDVKNVDLLKAAERYRQLLEVAEEFGVVPAIEIWGSRPPLNRLGQAALVALEAQHPKACILPDVYHLYKGGSSLASVGLLGPRILAGFHLNDYPADPPRETIRDRDRIYPGDGVAPLAQLVRDLRAIGYRGALSIELFNPDYYKQDPSVVAKTALEKTRAVIKAALG